MTAFLTQNARGLRVLMSFFSLPEQNTIVTTCPSEHIPVSFSLLKKSFGITKKVSVYHSGLYSEHCYRHFDSISSKSKRNKYSLSCVQLEQGKEKKCRKPDEQIVSSQLKTISESLLRNWPWQLPGLEITWKFFLQDTDSEIALVSWQNMLECGKKKIIINFVLTLSTPISPILSITFFLRSKSITVCIENCCTHIVFVALIGCTLLEYRTYGKLCDFLPIKNAFVLIVSVITIASWLNL